ncbi:Serine/threonine protein kinase [[Clostridium] aminophilum]|uniref:Serine/threonine protein kinase n=1 Tax=[Clostridium] aminophilum TaxID=1526 RepID=A0A1I0EJ19_9FIRM|nr:serine/threonine-protein kinase [[Clostridium] aminophilum]SET45415.1 Serine/threonine protein kinase [[Clostridium] aminophilum]
MKMVKCDQNHIYDGDRYAFCPYCRAGENSVSAAGRSDDARKTVFLGEEEAPKAAESRSHKTVFLGEEEAPKAAESRSHKTVFLGEEEAPKAAESRSHKTVFLGEEEAPEAAESRSHKTVFLGEEEAPKEAEGRSHKTVFLGEEEAPKAVEGRSHKTVFLGDEVAPDGRSHKTVFLGDGEKTDGAQTAKKKGDFNIQVSLSQNEQDFVRIHAPKLCLNCMKNTMEDDMKCCPDCGFRRNTPPRVAFHLAPGHVLSNRYIVGTVLGFGGFGISYKAWDTELKTAIAIKEYFPSGSANRIPGTKNVIRYSGKGKMNFEKGMERFREEALNTAKFNHHPNIVHVYDYFEENDTAYMTMELLQGTTLEEYVKTRGGKIPYQEAVRIFSFISDAVDAMHQKNMIHRDLSPDNIYLCNDGSIRLMDLGAARFSSNIDESDKTVVVKIGLAPPEQYHKKGHQGPWTDVYALCASLYWVVTGVEPVESTDRLKKDDLVTPVDIDPDIPDYLNRVILKGMALREDLRFRSMTEFRKALNNQEKVLALEKEIKKRKKKRAAILAAGFAAAALIGSGAWYYYSSQRKSVELGDVKVNLWVPEPAGTDEEMTRRTWENALGQFRTDYSHVDIEITCIPEEEYETKVLHSLDAEDAPDVFISDGIPAQQTAGFEDLSPALSLLDHASYRFFDEYEKMYSDHRQLPIGFRELAVYANPLMIREGDTSPYRNSVEDFCEKKSAFAIGDIGEYSEIQNVMPGAYTVNPPDHQAVVFDHFLSVNGSSSKEKRDAGVRVVYYLLGSAAQDVMFIENRSSMPLNKTSLENYFRVNAEIRAISDGIDSAEVVDPTSLEARKEAIFAELKKEDDLTYLAGTANTPEEQQAETEGDAPEAQQAEESAPEAQQAETEGDAPETQQAQTEGAPEEQNKGSEENG